MGLLMVTYPITRFLIEYLRNDEGVFFAGLHHLPEHQHRALLGGLAYWFWLSRLPRTRHADQVVEEPLTRSSLAPVAS